MRVRKRREARRRQRDEEREGKRGRLDVFPGDLDDTDSFVCEGVEEGGGHIYKGYYKSNVSSSALSSDHAGSRRTKVTR